ncbi:MAG: ATP-binding protein [Burkholderiales bacterium]|nr:ATP-binding protein [Burkholderiales bacterium]
MAQDLPARPDPSPQGERTPERRGPAVALLRLLVWLSVLLPALLLVAVGQVSWQERQHDLKRSLQHTLDLVHEHALRTFDTYALVAGQANEIVRGLSDEAVRAQEKDLNERLARLALPLPQIQDIWLIDASARPLVAAMVHPIPPISLGDRQYFRVHVAQQRPPYVSELLRGRVIDVTFFQISWRLRSAEGPFRGVLAVSVQPDYYREFHGRVARDTGLAIALMREDGAVLVSTPGSGEAAETADKRAAALITSFQQYPEGGLIELAASGAGAEERVAFRSIAGYPVKVVVAGTTAAVFGEWLLAMAGYLAIGIPATAGLFFLSLTALRQSASQASALMQLESEARRREAAESALRQVQKMEAVGRLTGGVAHDFNNLLTVIIGNLDMLMRRLGPDDARARRSASLAKEGAVRASLLTQRLLAFSRQQPLAPKRVDIDELITGMSDLTRRTLGETIHVSAETQAELWPVDVDPNQLENAILNLAVNARDAMPNGGGLTIRARNQTVTEQGHHADDPPPGDWVVVEVHDTGVGIPDDVQPKVFEPFFTTKPHGQGTGLGLSQVYGFIKQSGGHVRLFSGAGQGTTVRLYLPRAMGKAQLADRVQIPLPASGRPDPEKGRVVLVVEDEPTVRSFSVEAFRELGFEVLEAADATSALHLLASGTRAVDLLFSDIGLPGTDGRALAHQAVAQRPNLRVLLTSGYAHQIERDPGAGDFELLPKPFTADELAQRLRALFARPMEPGTVGSG